MPTRIGINGFGRMGRLALRARWAQAGLEFVHINEVARRENSLVIDGRDLSFLECSGKFRTTDKLDTYFDAGVKNRRLFR